MREYFEEHPTRRPVNVAGNETAIEITPEMREDFRAHKERFLAPRRLRKKEVVKELAEIEEKIVEAENKKEKEEKEELERRKVELKQEDKGLDEEIAYIVGSYIGRRRK